VEALSRAIAPSKERCDPSFGPSLLETARHPDLARASIGPSGGFEDELRELFGFCD
jgi:hypothetical protein